MRAAVALLVFAFAGQIVHAFQPGDAEVVALGTLALRCAMVALPTMAYSTTNNMMLQTVGETGRATLLSAARQGLFFIPAILILPWLFEFNGVMLAQPVADVCACLLAVPLSTGFLNKMRRMEQEKDLQS